MANAALWQVVAQVAPCEAKTPALQESGATGHPSVFGQEEMAAGTADRSVIGTVAAMIAAMRQIEPQVVAASAPFSDPLRGHEAGGLVWVDFGPTRGAEQALATCLEAVQAGRRAMCLTSSRGAAAMPDALRAASARRLPVVMAVLANHTPGPCHDPDALSMRDAGWIQIHAETPQEAYDTAIQAVRLAEHRDIHLPVMVVAPLSDLHARVEGDAEVRAFAHVPYLPGRHEPERAPLPLAIAVLHALGDEYGRRFGRRYAALDTWGLAEAELAIVALGAVAAAVRPTLAELGARGVRVGLVRPRLFFPFPGNELAGALRRARGVAVLEHALCRATADGVGAGPLYQETATALARAGMRPRALLSFAGDELFDPRYVAQMVADLQAAVRAGRQEVGVQASGPAS